MIHNSNRQNSFGLGRKNWIKYAGITMALAVVCTVAFFALWKTDVFGKFEAKEPYVTGDAVRKGVPVTTEGSNQKGKEGSGAKPCSDEVPTCSGKKGSETNPFVVLEIVPDKSQQQLVYLGQNDSETYPLDVMQIGINIAKKEGKTFAESSSPASQDTLKEMGQWFSNNSYSVYKIGEKDEKENMPFAYIDKLYSLKFTDEDINEAMKDDTAAERFADIFKETTQQYATNWHDIEKLSNKFPEMFQKDKKGKKIRDIALKDRYNWKASKETDVIQEFKSPGYMVMVEPGKGDFGFTSLENLRNWNFTKTGTDADRWVYIEDEAELAEKYPEYLEKYSSNNMLYSDHFEYIKEDGSNSYWTGFDVLFENMDSTAFTGLIYKIESWAKTPSLVEFEYTFDYFGVTNHNILKRSLFQFKDQKDYDDFHMEVICMTPAEINKISKSDNELTVDMIERADMYYIQSGDFDGNSVNETSMLEELYYTYVDPNASKPKEDITFYENDLEWSLCQKIIQRQSSVMTLPLVFNQMVGKMLEGGISRNAAEKETHMYVTAGNGDPSSVLTDVHAKGSRNNLSKLYLISIQFDLLARKENDESLERTFMEDIYPNIKTISIPNENGVVSGTAETTGYYDGTIANPRKLCTCDASQDFKERAYYLWNTYTFVPTDIEDQLNGNLSEDTKEHMVSLGYLDTYFNTNDGNAFSGSSSPSHQSGSDGFDLKNVTVVSDSSNSNTNHSSFLGNKGDGGGLANNMLEIIFQIMQNEVQDAHPVTVTAEEQRKMYVKIADDTVMIDYEDDGKLVGEDKDLYVKVRFWNNENNRSGQIKEIRLVNEEGQSKKRKLYTDKTLKQECANWKETENQYIVSVDDAYLEGYIKFKLSDWKNGYNILQFDTVGWHYCVNKKGKGELVKKESSSEISIIGRTLFNLE